MSSCVSLARISQLEIIIAIVTHQPKKFPLLAKTTGTFWYLIQSVRSFHEQSIVTAQQETC